jgi:DivIVA domain-containing protein
MRRKKGSEDALATGDARITPEEVQQVEFRLAFRGYNERDVDAFLDRITEGLSSYRQELEGVRSGSGLPLTAAAGSTGDADAIVARARAEADEIVRRAQEQAAGIRAAAGAGSSDARGAVAPFLNKEREFLQSLGGLVQTHAEEIKQMVMAIRERAEASASSEAPRPAAPISSAPEARSQAEPDRTGERGTAASAAPMAVAAQPADLEPASAAEIRERLQASEPPVEIGPADEDDLPPKAAAPIVVDSGTEPVFSTEGAPATERRERSLRELFWGED